MKTALDYDNSTYSANHSENFKLSTSFNYNFELSINILKNKSMHMKEKKKSYVRYSMSSTYRQAY